MPTHPDKIRVINFLTQQEYAIVGAGIDSRDWDTPNPEEAVLHIMQSLSPDKHIVVFHDGGGDRSRTIKILQLLIQRARNAGYQFIGLNDN